MNRTESPGSRWHLFAEACFIALLVVLSRVDWILSSLYHSAHAPTAVAGAVSLLFVGLAGALYLAALLVPRAWSGQVLRASVVMVAIYVLQAALRELPFMPLTLTVTHKVVAIVLSAAVAALMALRMGDALWLRTRWALIAACVVYALSPLILVQFTAPKVTVQVPPTLVNRPTVFLVLDELNANAAQPLIQALKAAGAKVDASVVAAVGANTITVLPEMLGAGHLPTAKVCSPSAVCDARGQFDFRQLTFAPSQHFHVVGFFHPYCEAQGWSSCERFGVPSVGAVKSLLCTFTRVLPMASSDSACEWMSPARWLVFREQVTSAVLASSFWSTGGVLFAHVPLPHPPGVDEGTSLEFDYEKNVAQAAIFVAQVWAKGQQSYGDGFQLVITSDHPLRPELWCRQAKYRDAGCQVPVNSQPKQVPFVVASSRSNTYPIPSSNGEIFETHRER
ncbi:hypothetical protein [Aquabacterium sp.]|uniref:hypothetical protein n=1 Tax=Aquabacterium sp. TaxID=1872578 RepID=UPI00199667D7|nr:hypothetical protein [Aquabacterium sp.]MBC7700859.1 hypothetical protein [Aquabacterium sp.]